MLIQKAKAILFHSARKHSTAHYTHHTTHSTQHTTYSTQHTAHTTLHTAHSTQHTPHYTQHTAHTTLHTAHTTHHTAHTTLHTAHSTHHTPHTTQHTAHTAQHTAHTTHHTTHSTQHTAHYTQHTAHSTQQVWECYSIDQHDSQMMCNVRYGKVITPSEVQDLVGVPEGRSHHNCLVTILLVVVVDGRHGLDTWVGEECHRGRVQLRYTPTHLDPPLVRNP